MSKLSLEEQERIRLAQIENEAERAAPSKDIPELDIKDEYFLDEFYECHRGHIFEAPHQGSQCTECGSISFKKVLL